MYPFAPPEATDRCRSRAPWPQVVHLGRRHTTAPMPREVQSKERGRGLSDERLRQAAADGLRPEADTRRHHSRIVERLVSSEADSDRPLITVKPSFVGPLTLTIGNDAGLGDG